MPAYENIGGPHSPAWEQNEDLLTGVDRFVDLYGVDLLDTDGVRSHRFSDIAMRAGPQSRESSASW